MGKIANFTSKGIIHIRRDAGWTDIVLPQNAIKASRRYCILPYHKGKFYLRDGDENAKASSNGKSTNGKRLPSGKWIGQPSSQDFNAAGVILKMA